MDKDKILEQVVMVFREELDEPALELSYTDSSKTVKKWDSVSNLMIIDALERRFQVTFDVDFIFKAENVGDLCDYILRHSPHSS